MTTEPPTYLFYGIHRLRSSVSIEALTFSESRCPGSVPWSNVGLAVQAARFLN